MTVVELNAWAIHQAYTRRAQAWILLALPVLLEELKRLTPENAPPLFSVYQS